MTRPRKEVAIRPSVIISTYNQPEWLEKALYGWAFQSLRDFELLVADDGSGERTRQVIEAMGRKTDLTIRHVWQEDRGFRKTRILNLAIATAQGNYLVFSDGDCIPRADFLQVHLSHAAPGRYLSGGYVKLPMALSQAITPDDIHAGRAFDIRWMRAQDVGMPRFGSRLKLIGPGWRSAVLNHVTTARPSWNGHNSSGWKHDLERVNGFDLRMGYGGEDMELGVRLVNAGVEPRRIRYLAACIHLDHARGYVSDLRRQRNDAILRNTRLKRKTWTPWGLDRIESP